MTTFYSSEYTAKYRTLPIDTNIHRNLENPLRYKIVHYTQSGNGTIDDFLYLCKVPGDARIIIPACIFTFSAWAANTLLDVGYAAHTSKTGATVAADPDGLIDGLDVDAAGTYTQTMLATAGGVTYFHTPALLDLAFDARGEVDIIAQFRVAAPTDTDTLYAAIAYII